MRHADSVNNVQSRSIVKTVDLQGAFVSIVLDLKGLVLEFLKNRRSWEIKNLQNIARKAGFSEPCLLSGVAPGKPNQRQASSWTFPGGIPEQNFSVNRACFHKNGRNSYELFVLALSLVLVCERPLGHRSRTQKWHFRWLKNDFSGSRKSDSKMTPKMTFLWERVKFWVIFESLSPRPWKVIFGSFLSHFNCFAIPGPVAPSPDHKVWFATGRLLILFTMHPSRSRLASCFSP